MRQRIVSAVFGIAFGVIVLFFYNTFVLNVVVAAAVSASVYEALIATHLVKDRALYAVCAVFAAAAPFLDVSFVRRFDGLLCYLFILALFIYLIARDRKVRLELVGTAFLLTVLLSFSLSCIVYVRDLYRGVSPDPARGLFYICLLFFGAWMTDAGAYFIGVFFGRHKLAPHISPKKTVEGAVGGFVVTLLSFCAAALVYSAICKNGGVAVTVNVAALVSASILCSAAAIFGDLSASLIKRESNIKDFGNVLPGHGGVLDRFDSIMFVAPLLYIFIQYIPILK